MVRAGFKVNDTNSVLGVLWSLLSPLAMLVVLYFVFRTYFGERVPAYPLYLLVGIVFVGFFMTASRYMITVFFGHNQLLQNTTVPRETVVAAALSPHLTKLGIEVVLCAAFSAAFGLLSAKAMLFLAPLLVAYVMLIVGIGLLLATAFSVARDVDHLWMLASRLLFFVTPVFYDLDSVSAVARNLIYWLNPLTPFVTTFRDLFMGAGRLAAGPYLHSVLLGLVAFAIGYAVFLRFENTVVERA